jgi:hypothetical protein
MFVPEATSGNDNPLKYPVVFQVASLLAALARPNRRVFITIRLSMLRGRTRLPPRCNSKSIGYISANFLLNIFEFLNEKQQRRLSASPTSPRTFDSPFSSKGLPSSTLYLLFIAAKKMFV